MDALERIALALERLAPADPAQARVARWVGGFVAAEPAPGLPLEAFVGLNAQAEALRRNLGALAAGRPAHDMLLWGARGCGKSALLRAAVAATPGVHLVAADALTDLPALFAALPPAPAFVVFIDDVVADADAARRLRSLLDGGASARPANARLAATSNHRHLVERRADAGARHQRDSDDDALALADRFGLSLGFHVPDQESWLRMVAAHAAELGVSVDERAALEVAVARGRSGRSARHAAIEAALRV